MPWSKEEAAEQAKRGGQARAEKERALRETLRSASPEAAAAVLLQKNLPDFARVLTDAALGEGEFANLDPRDRLTAIKLAMEYAVGKPTARKTGPEETKQEEDAAGIVFD